MDQVQVIVAMLSQLMDWLRPFVHLNLLLKVWFVLILHTTDFETGHDFTTNSTIQAFEPTVQLVADGALTLVVIWASYRVMWGHGLRSQYTARIMLPRLFMAAVLINFSLPLVQALVQASNAASDAIQSFGTVPDWQNWLQNLVLDPSSGLLQIVATAVLVVGYEILGIAYLIRYTILIV